MSVKRLLDCTPSELARYTKAELLDAIAGSEGRARRGHQSGALRPAGRQKQRWNALENERRTLGHRRKCTQGRRNGR